MTLVAGGGTAGTADGTGSAAQFNLPRAMCSDGTNLYVADSQNHSIRKVVVATGVVTTLAGLAGTPGYVDATGTSARFNDPMGICTDGTSLFVADSGNNCIRRIDITTGAVTTFAGSTTPGYVNATGTAARFQAPQDICRVGTDFYATDSINNAIRKVTAAGEVTTFAGDVAGSPGLTDAVGTAARFTSPSGICFDGWGLLVNDEGFTFRDSRFITIPGAAVSTISMNEGAVLTVTGSISDGARSIYTPYGTDMRRIVPSQSFASYAAVSIPVRTGGPPLCFCFIGSDLYASTNAIFGIYKLTITANALPLDGWFNPHS